jgi:protein-disulfide isomerase
MKTKRILFASAYIILIGLLAWWLAVVIIKAMSGNTAKTDAPLASVPEIDAPRIDTSKIGIPANVTYADHILGPFDAPVTLIEYGDFECQLCSESAAIVERLADEYGATLRIVFRHFPLPQHQNALIAAQASEAAAVYGKFWDMYEILNADRAAWADLSGAEIITALAGYAARIGLDERQFFRDLDSPAAKRKVEDDRVDGKSINIFSTPAFFVNGKAIQVPGNFEQFKVVIDAAALDAGVSRSGD